MRWREVRVVILYEKFACLKLESEDAMMRSISVSGLADKLRYQDLGDGCREMETQRMYYIGSETVEPRIGVYWSLAC